MIDLETKLKLQAFVDNELNARDARKVAAQLEREPEARAFCAELKQLRELVVGNELEIKLPESREFFWSKIEREILRTSAQGAEPNEPTRSWWLRIMAPAVGVAMMLVVAVVVFRPSTMSPQLSALREIETPLEETSSISFHSESAGMTVVWVQTQGH